MVHGIQNSVYDRQQQHLFSKKNNFTKCPAECGQVEYDQHYLSCKAPPMVLQREACMKNWGKRGKTPGQPH